MTIAHTLRRLVRKVGVDFYRANPMTMPALRLCAMLGQRRIRTVLDVGANDGGYATDLLEGGFEGQIVSFEPLLGPHTVLQARTARYSNWTVGPRIALSDREGTATFHEAGNSVSSSLLEMTTTHSEAAPDSAPVRSVEVMTKRLDDIFHLYDRPLFLKLDVQGGEGLVLDGATSALNSIVGIQLEMSMDTLYAGQSTARDLDERLRALGFECWDIHPGFRNPTTFRMLQYDGVYFRK